MKLENEQEIKAFLDEILPVSSINNKQADEYQKLLQQNIGESMHCVGFKQNQMESQMSIKIKQTANRLKLNQHQQQKRTSQQKHPIVQQQVKSEVKQINTKKESDLNRFLKQLRE